MVWAAGGRWLSQAVGGPSETTHPARVAGRADASRPNILLIFIDDLGYGELGCQGNPQIPTPNIDSLARNGIRFTQGYVTAAYCSPSRAGLLTGRYQSRFGHELNPVGRRNLDERAGLPLSERTIADELKAGGYETALVGKWHLGGLPQFHPQRRGFDEFFGFLHEGHFYVPGPPWPDVLTWLRTRELPEGEGPRQRDGNVIRSTHLRNNEPPYDESNPILRGTEPVVEREYLTEALTREATAFVEQNASRPWFLYLSYNAPHSPMQAPTGYLERFRHIEDIHRRLFAAMVAALDDSIGAVLAKLRELKLEEDTLIFFLSDNGGPTAELTSSNAPLRGGKGQLFEGGIRVPFLMQWKGRLPAGKVVEQPVISLDILPTALAAARVSRPAGDKLDGSNLLPWLCGDAPAPGRRTFFWRYGRNVALRDGDWKLVRQSAWGKRDADFALFDLTNDVGETKDLTSTHPEVAKELRAKLDRLDAEMVEPLLAKPPRAR
jgi:arylsulfatase B